MTPPTSEATATETRPTPRSGGRVVGLLRKYWAPLLLVVASLGAMVPITQSHGHQFSPVDEWMYYDYLTKVPDQGVVHRGEPVSEDSLRAMACTGVQVYGPMGDRCSRAELRAEKFPFEGITTADTYTPLYFWSTFAGAKVIEAAGVDNFLFAARLTSPLWLALGMLLFYALLRRFRVSDLMIVGLGLIFIGTPLAYWTFSFVGTDAPSFAFGCALLLVAKLISERRVRPWVLMALSVLATLFKVTNILGVLLACAFLLAYYLLSRERGARLTALRLRSIRTAEDRHLLVAAVGAGLAAAVAQIVWLIIRAMIAVGPVAPQEYSGVFGLDELGNQALGMLAGTLNSNVTITGASELGYPMPAYLGRPVIWLAVLGVFGALLIRPRIAGLATDAARFSVAAVAVTAGPLLATALFLTQDFYFSMPARYGLAIVAGFMLMFGMLFNRNRWVHGVAILYGIALIGWGLNYSVLAGG